MSVDVDYMNRLINDILVKVMNLSCLQTRKYCQVKILNGGRINKSKNGR